MPAVQIVIVFTAACLLTAVGLVVFLRVHPRLGLLDIPNERRSHSTPVPRGGGVVVVVVTVVAYLAASSSLDFTPDLVFVLAGLGIAGISFIDDIRSISFLPRLSVQILAASVFVWHTGGFPGLMVPLFGSIQFGLAGPVLSVLFIVWMTNAYNFMDGIDGILGAQTLSAGAAWAALGFAAGWPTGSIFGSIIAGCSLGFLFFNWQPARVFMGDVGSTFIGFCIAGLPLIPSNGSRIDEVGALTFSMLFSLFFLFDTFYTRVELIAKGRNFWQPHREHLYQKLVRSGASHSSISTYYGLASLFVSVAGITAALTFGAAFAVVAAILSVASCSILLYWAHKRIVDPSAE